MKKVLAICLMAVMVLGLSIPAFAAPGGFVSSPSGNQAPEIVEYHNESKDCKATLDVTPYADRNSLSEDACKKLEDAYSAVVNAKDLTSLSEALNELAKKLGIKASDLAVSDMFDISCNGCDDHENHGAFDITLKAETLKNFVCLLHYYNGEWKVVTDAEVTNNGTHLEFTEKEFSPFAIVVNTAAAGNAGSSNTTSGNANSGNTTSKVPQTGESNMIYVCAAAAVVSIVGIAVISSKSKKNRA